MGGLSTFWAGVEGGFRLVLRGDAWGTPHDKTHDALMTLYRERFTNQVETTSTDRVLREWRF